MTRLQRLFGLLIDSDLELPLPPVESEWGTEPCIRVRRGSVNADGELVWDAPPPVEFRCFRRSGLVVLEWAVARFEVAAGHVVVDTSDPDTAAVLLMQAVWSVVLSTHARAAFHGGTVARGGRAIAILGESGSGKSTALLSLLDRGWSLVADDMLVLDEHLRALPGPPFIRLLEDRAAGRAGIIDPVGKLRYFPNISADPVPLAGLIVHTDLHQQPSRLTGTAAVGALLSHMYNDVVPFEGLRGLHFRASAALAQQIPIYGAPPRSLSPEHLDQMAAEAGIL